MIEVQTNKPESDWTEYAAKIYAEKRAIALETAMREPLPEQRILAFLQGVLWGKFQPSVIAELLDVPGDSVYNVIAYLELQDDVFRNDNEEAWYFFHADHFKEHQLELIKAKNQQLMEIIKESDEDHSDTLNELDALVKVVKHVIAYPVGQPTEPLLLIHRMKTMLSDAIADYHPLDQDTEPEQIA